MKADARGGFSLLEVLVAVAVFSLAALALVNVTTEGLRSQARAETRTLGGVVADNALVEAMAAPGRLPPGQVGGATELAGRTWRWTRRVEPTADPDLQRLTIGVTVDGERAAMRTAYRAVR